MEAPVSQAKHQWLILTHYRVRVVSYVALMVPIGMHIWGKGYGTAAWVLLVLHFLIYPHLLYLYTRGTIDPLRTERFSLQFECFLFGMWSAALAFPDWITFALILGPILNNAIMKGWPGPIRAVLYFSAGILSWALFGGFRFSPDTELPVTVWCLMGLSIYVAHVGNTIFAQHVTLRATRETLRREEQERQKAQEILSASNIELQSQLAEIQQLHAQLHDQAMRDSLTGLYNRRYLNDMLERELARARRETYPLSLMMIDLDHFKKVNDTYGHQAGDEVLKYFSGMLNERARAEDILCRYGGEEFLLLLPKMPLEVARERAEQWRSDFQALTVAVGEHRIQTTLSVGIAAYPDHGTTPDQLTQNADLALYIAKKDGRNRVVIYSPQ
jgi:diguanylate cyclase (GGDEF)-like protein